MMRSALVLICLTCVLAQAAYGAGQAAFVAVDPAGAQPLPAIVVQYDAAHGTGYRLDELARINPQSGYIRELNVLRAARYLQEGIRRMTGRELPIENNHDLTRGITLTTLAGAPADVKNDPAVREALRNTGEDAYNANEAFFIRSETDRLLIVANTPHGLVAAVVELLETVEYEVLGLGPQWVHVPDYTQRPLIFNLQRAGRPGYYLRGLFYPSAYNMSFGNLNGMTLRDPADESFDRTFERWAIGARFSGRSMPYFPGHALQAFHPAVIAHMRKTGTDEGFLVDKVTRGLTEDMPDKGEKDVWELWFSTDPEEFPTSDTVYRSYGDKWLACNLLEVGFSLDVSVPWVRHIILDAAKKTAETSFREYPDELVIIDTEPEDGAGYLEIGKRMKYPNWYPEYLRQEGLPFGRDYALHGWRGIDQPKEIWDPEVAANTVFGLKNWVLRELDKWIDAMPPAQQATSTGQAKKALLRNSGYSYAYHDIPPTFNLDQRVRIQIAGFAKHRGRGKWKGIINTHEDTARAFKVLLPREPSGDYRIIGTDAFNKSTITGVPPTWDQSPAAIHRDLQGTYQAGIKALNYEIEYMFGRFGLGYYLMSKMLWNPNMTLEELDAIRDRWFRRAFGSAWQEMKAYYDFMLKENYPRNMPRTWATAIRLIDAAGAKLEGTKEADAQRRIDDLKVFWYYHYLLDNNTPADDLEELEAQLDERAEFAWKGQMAHTVFMRRAVPGLCGSIDAAKAGGEYAAGPAHYTHAEVQERWQRVLACWKPIPVDQFAERTLADGTKGQDVDLHDLVMVKEFAGGPPESFIYSNNYYAPSTQFLTVARKAGETIGFIHFWPAALCPTTEVAYGLERWDAERKVWERLRDKAVTVQPATVQEIDWGGNQRGEYRFVEVRVAAPQAGAYRFDMGPGGVGAGLASLNFNTATGKYAEPAFSPHTFAGSPSALTQSGIYFYIPKGTKSLDLDIWDTHQGKTLILHTGLPHTGLTRTRRVDISALGTHRVPLRPGEDGSIAQLEQNGFAPPVCYSIPGLWAKSPSALFLPRALARADGLTIVE